MTVKNYAYYSSRYAVKKALERGDLVKLDYCEVCGDRPTFGAENEKGVRIASPPLPWTRV